jgi:hypothetical protein
MRSHTPRGLAVVGALVALAAGLLVTVALAGCGGGGEAEGTDRRAETAIVEDDQSLAEDIVLRLSDFPAGWRLDPDDGGEGDESDETIYDGCVNLDFSELVLTGEANSKYFVSDTAMASSGIGIYAESADQAFEQVASDETATCIQNLFREVMETEFEEDPELELGDVTGSEISFPALGDRSRAHRIVVEVNPTEMGLWMEAYFDVVYIQRGRGVALLIFYDVLTPFDRALEVELAERVAARMSRTI